MDDDDDDDDDDCRYFSRFELPYLLAPRVTGVRILFAQNSASPPRFLFLLQNSLIFNV